MRIPLAALFIFAAIFVAEAKPQYLSQPVTPSSPGNKVYRALLSRRLLVTPADYGRMLMQPAFKPEYAVSVYAVRSKTRQSPSRFRITLTEATKSLWHSISPTAFGDRVADIKIVGDKVKIIDRPPQKDHHLEWKVPVRRIDVDIDEQFATAIRDAWQAMLAKDPLPSDERVLVMDADNVLFCATMPNGKSLCREIDPAPAPPASDFLKLGNDLADFCRASSEQRARQQPKLLKKLRRFAKSLK